MVNVLIADDEYPVRYAVRRALEDFGHTVFEAQDGLEAINIIDTEHVDVAMIDVVMPNMDGVETTIKIHREHPSVKIIAISGGGHTSNMDYLNAAKKFGAKATLRKPFSNEELLNIITT